MADPLLMPMANAMVFAYDDNNKPTWENPSKTCHVYHQVVNGINTFAFEGTTDFAEWMQDFNPLTEATAYPQIGPVHQDSLENVLAVLPFITAKLDELGKPPCYVLGHSKGAREGPILHALLKALGYTVLAGYYFEPPKAGGDMLVAWLVDQVIITTQTYNASGSDIVTLVPDGLGWSNVRPFLRLQVPDNFGIRDKHVISGVIAGIKALA